MKKLKDILNESQHLSYKRMNVGEEKEEKGMTNEEKREFLKAVSEYKKFGEAIYRSGNLAEVYESVKSIVETAHKVTLEETGDWFDKVTVNRHMKSMNESFKVFEKTIHEVNTLQQRLESCYDEMGEVLGKYYEIKEGNEFGAARAKAIANGDSEFEVDGKKFPVKDVDKDDKENAKKFAKESVNEEYVKSMGYKAVTDKIDSLTKSLDPNGILCKNISKKADNVKSEFKQMKKHIDSIEQLWGEVDYVIEMSKMSNESVNESKYTVINPKNGNVMGAGLKDQAAKLSKKMGGEKKGYYVIPMSNAKKARRALEKFNFDLKNQKLHSMLGDLYYEGVDESVNEGRVSAKKLLQSVVKGETDRVEGIKLSKEMAQSFLDWQRLSPFGKKYGTLPFNRLFTAAFSFGLNRYADKKSKEYKELEAKANQMFKARRGESVNEGKHDAILDKLADIVKGAKSFMDIGKEFKYADGAERVVGDTAIGLMESLSEEAHSKSTLDTVARRMFNKSYSRLTMNQAARVKAALREIMENGDSMKLMDIMNEGASSEEKRIVMMAVRKIAKYRNVDIKTAVMDVWRAAEELERDIKKGKVKK